MFKIRCCINETAAKAGVHSMITSKLDYCNAILYGLLESTLKHFTRVQNLSACFISQHGEYEHITQVLKQLHWLPVYQRICYKVLILTFKSLNGQAPTYLEGLMKRRPMKRTRVDGNIDLVIPAIKHKSFGGRSVGYGGPKLWNTLLKELKTCTNINAFKKFLEAFFYLKMPTCTSYIHNVHFCFLFIYLFIPLFYTFYIFIFVNTYFFIYTFL